MEQPPQPGDRGNYEHSSTGPRGILALALVGVGIYALSPGARHWYKHGRLPR